MDDKVELGGNIELSGFKDIDGGSMIIVKKMVGQYAKDFSDNSKDFEKLAVNVAQDGDFAITSELSAGGQTTSAEAKNINLFMALDQSLKKLKN